MIISLGINLKKKSEAEKKKFLIFLNFAFTLIFDVLKKKHRKKEPSMEKAIHKTAMHKIYYGMLLLGSQYR